MKSLCWVRWLLLWLGCVLSAGVASPQSTNDLPSAPSATNQPKPAAPVQSAPSEPTQPAAPTQSAQPSEAPVEQASPDNANADRSDVIDQGGTTIRVPVNEVSVVFTVTDKHNRYVKDLTKKDFAVLDDQQPVVN